MHLEAEIVELREALGGHDRASLEMHLGAVIERVWRCTWTPSAIEIEGVLGGGRSGAGRSAGRCDGSLDCIHWVTRNCGNVENGVQTDWEPETVNHGMMQYVVYAVLGVCCTPCMLYSVSTVDHGM